MRWQKGAFFEFSEVVWSIRYQVFEGQRWFASFQSFMSLAGHFHIDVRKRGFPKEERPEKRAKGGKWGEGERFILVHWREKGGSLLISRNEEYWTPWVCRRWDWRGGSQKIWQAGLQTMETLAKIDWQYCLQGKSEKHWFEWAGEARWSSVLHLMWGTLPGMYSAHKDQSEGCEEVEKGQLWS